MRCRTKASSPLERPILTVTRLVTLIRSGDDAPLFHLAIVHPSAFNRAVRAVENAAPVEIRKERGFPQGAWKVRFPHFPQRLSFLSNSKTQRSNYRATLRGAPHLAYADSRMKNLLLTLLHLAVMTAKLCGPGGVRAVIAENLVLKQQLIILRRARRRAPNLTRRDRLLCGFWSIFLRPGRIRRVARALRPSTLLSFHQALVRR